MTGNLLKTSKRHQDYVSFACFSHDDVLIMSSSWHKIMKLWDKVSRNLLETFEGHIDYRKYPEKISKEIKKLCVFFIDKTFIFCGCGDKNIKLWEKVTGYIPKTFERNQEVVSLVCFSPCGTLILSCTLDYLVKF